MINHSNTVIYRNAKRLYQPHVIAPFMVSFLLAGCFATDNGNKKPTDPIVINDPNPSNENKPDPNDPNKVVASIPGFDTKPVPVKRPDPNTLKHKALLGPLAGATVEVSSLAMPDTIFATTTTEADGSFVVDVPESLGHKLLLITVTDGIDTDANDDGVTDGDGTENKGTLRMIVNGDRLGTTAVNVTVLSDAIARKALIYATYLPEEEVGNAIQKMSYELLKGDINGDETLNYLDILKFNPSIARHKNSLAFSYTDAVLAKQIIGQNSLVDKYHNNSKNLDQGVAEAFQRILSKVNMPTPQEAERVSINLKANIGGDITSIDRPDLITFANGSPLFSFNMGKEDAPVSLQAVADDGFEFSQWIGCLNVQQDGTCLVKPEENQLITAYFKLPENKVAADVTSVVNLTTADPNHKVGVVFEGSELIVTTKADSPLSAELSSIQPNSVFHTGIVKRPQVKITQVLSSETLVGNKFNQTRFAFEDIDLFDTYDEASFEMGERTMTLDDLVNITYSDMVDDEDKTISLDTTANREFAPGPSPLDEANGDPNMCNETEEALYKKYSDSGDAEVICVSKNEEPLALDEYCPDNQVETMVLDGRIFCTESMEGDDPLNDGGDDPFNDGGDDPFNDGLDPLYDDTVQTSNYSMLSSKLQQAKDQGLVTAKKKTKEVWLADYGRAFDLGDGVYVTNNPNKSGILMIEIDGEPTVLAENEARQEYINHCLQNELTLQSKGCVSVQNYASVVLPANQTPLQFEIPLPKKYSKWLSVEIKFQVELELKASGSAKWIKPLRAEVTSAGTLTVTPIIGVDVTASGGALFEKNGSKNTIGKKEEEAEIYQKIVSYDFAASTPAGAVFAAGIELGAGVDVAGELKLETQIKTPTSINWNGSAAAGWGCKSSRVERSEKRSGGIFGWFTRIIEKVVNTDCSSSKYVHFKVQPTSYARLDTKLTLNAIVEPYLQLGLTSGARGVAEKFMQLNGRAFAQAQLSGETPTLSVSNIPADLRARGGKSYCFMGNWKLLGGLYAGFRANYVLTTHDQPIGKVLNFKQDYLLAEIKFPLIELGWDGKPVARSLTSPELSTTFKSEDENQCGKPIPATKEFYAGSFVLNRGQDLVTKKVIFAMQHDGNLVLYANNNGNKGKFLWASWTHRRGGTKAVFQSDGNLIVYNTSNWRRPYPVWSSNTYLKGIRLVFEENGNVTIYDSYNRPIWTTNTRA